jgi:FkbM family methyltransferase
MGYFESDAAAARAIIERGYTFPVIFDVGGSNGSWSTTMAPIFKGSRFELFEPLAELHPEYKRVLTWMRETFKNHHMHPVAIGDKDGSITINVYDNPSASSTLTGLSDQENTQTVPMRSLDSIVASGMCAQPDLIKIDIQGGELAALKGAVKTLKHTKFLMLETWLQRGYGKSTPLLTELIEFLKPHGFVPYEFGDTFRAPNGETVSIDVWFINKAKAQNQHMF